jgi:hypothetical protein
MKGWNECPDCWGTGLIGGFQAPCNRREFSISIERWDRKEEQKWPDKFDFSEVLMGAKKETNARILNSDLGKALTKEIARILILRAIERVFGSEAIKEEDA